MGEETRSLPAVFDETDWSENCRKCCDRVNYSALLEKEQTAQNILATVKKICPALNGYCACVTDRHEMNYDCGCQDAFKKKKKET